MNDENLIRTAKVSSVDYKTGMVSVTYKDKNGATSAKMPMMNFNDEYYMPSIGSQVQVLLLSNGSSRGVVLGNTWQKGNMPHETGKGVYRKDFSKTPGACTVRYNDSSGEYAVSSGMIALYALTLLKLTGAAVNIGANGKITAESPVFDFMVPELNLLGGEEGELAIASECDIIFSSAEKSVESQIRSEKKEISETYEIEAGQEISVSSGMGVSASAGRKISMNAGTTLELEDSSYRTTLSDILSRLEALDGDTSARK